MALLSGGPGPASALPQGPSLNSHVPWKGAWGWPGPAGAAGSTLRSPVCPVRTGPHACSCVYSHVLIFSLSSHACFHSASLWVPKAHTHSPHVGAVMCAHVQLPPVCTGMYTSVCHRSSHVLSHMNMCSLVLTQTLTCAHVFSPVGMNTHTLSPMSTHAHRFSSCVHMCVPSRVLTHACSPTSRTRSFLLGTCLLRCWAHSPCTPAQPRLSGVLLLFGRRVSVCAVLGSCCACTATRATVPAPVPAQQGRACPVLPPPPGPASPGGWARPTCQGAPQDLHCPEDVRPHCPQLCPLHISDGFVLDLP